MTTTAKADVAHSAWSLSHADQERERAITHVPYAERQGQAAERRERVKGALILLLELDDPDLLLEMLGIPAEEIALARRVHHLLGEVTP